LREFPLTAFASINICVEYVIVIHINPQPYIYIYINLWRKFLFLIIDDALLKIINFFAGIKNS